MEIQLGKNGIDARGGSLKTLFKLLSSRNAHFRSHARAALTIALSNLVIIFPSREHRVLTI